MVIFLVHFRYGKFCSYFMFKLDCLILRALVLGSWSLWEFREHFGPFPWMMHIHAQFRTSFSPSIDSGKNPWFRVSLSSLGLGSLSLWPSLYIWTPVFPSCLCFVASHSSSLGIFCRLDSSFWTFLFLCSHISARPPRVWLLLSSYIIESFFLPCLE